MENSYQSDDFYLNISESQNNSHFDNFQQFKIVHVIEIHYFF